jgi:Fur family iron response transcriptional regulator
MNITTTFDHSEAHVVDVLKQAGVQPTSQRVLITRLLFRMARHLSAEDVYRAVNVEDRQVSKATVYNTLGLLTSKGVIREVIADPDRVFYDPNTAPHHHFYDVDTGKLTDISAADVAISGLPSPPAGSQLDGVEVIVRLRSAR